MDTISGSSITNKTTNKNSMNRVIKKHTALILAIISAVALVPLAHSSSNCTVPTGNGTCGDTGSGPNCGTKCVKTVCTGGDSNICSGNSGTKECSEGTTAWSCAKTQYPKRYDEKQICNGCDTSVAGTAIVGGTFGSCATAVSTTTACLNP